MQEQRSLQALRRRVEGLETEVWALQHNIPYLRDVSIPIREKLLAGLPADNTSQVRILRAELTSEITALTRLLGRFETRLPGALRELAGARMSLLLVKPERL